MEYALLYRRNGTDWRFGVAVGSVVTSHIPVLIWHLKGFYIHFYISNAPSFKLSFFPCSFEIDEIGGASDLVISQSRKRLRAYKVWGTPGHHRTSVSARAGARAGARAAGRWKVPFIHPTATANIRVLKRGRNWISAVLPGGKNASGKQSEAIRQSMNWKKKIDK